MKDDTKKPAAHSMQPEDTPELRALYAGFKKQHIKPLWTQIGNLMPQHPSPQAVPHIWKWADLLPLAQRSGDLIPVGRGGERRALGLANLASAAMPISARRSGARSNILAPVRRPLSIVIHKTPSDSWSKAKASGPS